MGVEDTTVACYANQGFFHSSSSHNIDSLRGIVYSLFELAMPLLRVHIVGEVEGLIPAKR